LPQKEQLSARSPAMGFQARPGLGITTWSTRPVGLRLLGRHVEVAVEKSLLRFLGRLAAVLGEVRG
jgi:hypothetical protein